MWAAPDEVERIGGRSRCWRLGCVVPMLGLLPNGAPRAPLHLFVAGHGRGCHPQALDAHRPIAQPIIDVPSAGRGMMVIREAWWRHHDPTLRPASDQYPLVDHTLALMSSSRTVYPQHFVTLLANYHAILLLCYLVIVIRCSNSVSFTCYTARMFYRSRAHKIGRVYVINDRAGGE